MYDTVNVVFWILELYRQCFIWYSVEVTTKQVANQLFLAPKFLYLSPYITLCYNALAKEAVLGASHWIFPELVPIRPQLKNINETSGKFMQRKNKLRPKAVHLQLTS